MRNFFNKLIGKDDRFFELLESASKEAHDSATILETLYSQVGDSDVFDKTLEDLHVCRKKAKKLIMVISEDLCTKFATPIDRDDIEALCNALYRVPKNSCKIGERLSICPGKFRSDVVKKQISMLCQASGIVVRMTGTLRAIKHVEKIQDDYELVQTIEGDADKLMVGLLRALYQETVSSKEVIILKDIYERLEDTIDFCRDAAKIIFQVALKYS
ncbi:MAG: DUF47 domain-containing protein [Opitutae bacterium]|nr:DUF47 domain-containing protein [Opitutae bacterium]MCD8299346.1 DUF47 domain-containing protein [Opitutae bacterium]